MSIMHQYIVHGTFAKYHAAQIKLLKKFIPKTQTQAINKIINTEYNKLMAKHHSHQAQKCRKRL